LLPKSCKKKLLLLRQSRIRGDTINAEDILHDIEAISIISSDSQGMGSRVVGEVVRLLPELGRLLIKLKCKGDSCKCFVRPRVFSTGFSSTGRKCYENYCVNMNLFVFILRKGSCPQSKHFSRFSALNECQSNG
jgi:hypothetical protein